MSALDFERHRTEQRPGFWLLGCDVVYSCALTDGARTGAFFILCMCLAANPAFLIFESHKLCGGAYFEKKSVSI